MAINEAVQRGIEDIRLSYPETAVTAEDDGQGGAWVLLESVELGETYNQPTTWIGFRVTFQYPYADVYPHFVRADLVRKDGKPLGDGITGGHVFLGRPALQLSRRSNRLNPLVDTAAMKLGKVLQWLRNHP